MVLTWSATFEAGSRPVPSAQKCWNVRRCLLAYPDAPDRKYGHIQGVPHRIHVWNIYLHVPLNVTMFHLSWILLGVAFVWRPWGSPQEHRDVFVKSGEVGKTNMLFLLEIFTQNDSIERECTCKMMWMFFLVSNVFCWPQPPCVARSSALDEQSWSRISVW